MDFVEFYKKHVERLEKAGNQYKGICPFHSDKDTSFLVNPDNGLWHCLECGKGGDTKTFCKGRSINEKQAPDYDPNYISYCYPGGVIHKCSIEQKKRSMGIEFWEGPRDEWYKRPFNEQAIDLARENRKTLWICEGESDALTLWNAGEMAIGIPGSENTRVLNRITFVDIPKVIVAGDNDNAGRKFSEDVLHRFPFVETVKWPNLRFSKGYDVKEHKDSNPDGFVSDLIDWAAGMEPYEFLEKQLMDKLDKDKSRDPDQPLGYPLSKFKRLSDNIDGVQPGFYIVGTEANTGKTAFLCNLTLDLLDSNKGLTGIYFTLDDNKEIVLNRLLSIKTNIPLNLVQRWSQDKSHGGRLKADHDSILMRGYDYLRDLAQGRRLFIRDASEIENIHDLELETKRRMNRKLFVIIDGLYNLDVAGIGDKKKEDVEKVNTLKNLADIYRIPVICTGELRKMEAKGAVDHSPTIHDLMETGRWASNANFVILIYPDDRKDYDDKDEPVLKLKYAKNKLSHYRRIDSLKFSRNTGRFEEV